MSEDSKSNREKVYTAQGSVLFAKAYNCSPPRPETPHTLSIFLSAFTAKETIWKSPESQFNKNKICSKGKTLYVVGDVCGPGSRECLMFSSESWVFKRMWAKIEKYVEAAGVCVEETEVICEGCAKDKENGKEVVVEVEEEESETGRKRRERGGRRRRRRRNDKMMRAMKVQFTNDPMSCVWFTESALHTWKPLCQHSEHNNNNKNKYKHKLQWQTHFNISNKNNHKHHNNCNLQPQTTCQTSLKSQHSHCRRCTWTTLTHSSLM